MIFDLQSLTKMLSVTKMRYSYQDVAVWPRDRTCARTGKGAPAAQNTTRTEHKNTKM
jgi:hypothetical protein